MNDSKCSDSTSNYPIHTQGWATLSKVFCSFLKWSLYSKRKEFAEQMFSPLESTVFQKGTDVQGSKDQVTKVREYIMWRYRTKLFQSTKRRKYGEQILIKQTPIMNKSKKILWEQRTHTITKIGDSVWLSLFIYNTEVCETAYAPPPLLAPASAVFYFKITRMVSMIQREIK